MNRKANRRTVFIYLAPAMIVILIFLYLPIILNFVNSLLGNCETRGARS